MAERPIYLRSMRSCMHPWQRRGVRSPNVEDGLGVASSPESAVRVNASFRRQHGEVQDRRSNGAESKTHPRIEATLELQPITVAGVVKQALSRPMDEMGCFGRAGSHDQSTWSEDASPESKLPLGVGKRCLAGPCVPGACVRAVQAGVCRYLPPHLNLNNRAHELVACAQDGRC
jgi:hypothetical protein